MKISTFLKILKIYEIKKKKKYDELNESFLKLNNINETFKHYF